MVEGSKFKESHILENTKCDGAGWGAYGSGCHMTGFT
jgi:hypothetical protein